MTLFLSVRENGRAQITTVVLRRASRRGCLLVPHWALGTLGIAAVGALSLPSLCCALYHFRAIPREVAAVPGEAKGRKGHLAVSCQLSFCSCWSSLEGTKNNFRDHGKTLEPVSPGHLWETKGDKEVGITTVRLAVTGGKRRVILLCSLIVYREVFSHLRSYRIFSFNGCIVFHFMDIILN